MFVCVCVYVLVVYVCMCHGTPVEVRRRLSRISSQVLPCGARLKVIFFMYLSLNISVNQNVAVSYVIYLLYRMYYFCVFQLIRTDSLE